MQKTINVLEQSPQKVSHRSSSPSAVQIDSEIEIAGELNDGECGVLGHTPNKQREMPLFSLKGTDTFKQMKVVGSDSRDVSEHMFVPHQAEGYSVYYAPQSVFMFIKFFYAIYERVVQAKALIADKIKTDLSEMPLNEKVQAGIIDAKGQLNKAVSDMFHQERYEYLLKGIVSTCCHQGPGTLNPSTLLAGGSNFSMDHSKYEDFARQLLGQNAFLLFQIEKIVGNAIKQLQQMHADSAF